ncbi:LLM class F420-dependent oxidoreductase [bacterium]|nr:LLM class F420-dependent oxidoreductase [bacterium]
MKVGIMPLFGGDTAQPEYVARIARGLEERGFHSVWAVDHILLPTQFDSKYPYSADGSFPVDPAVQGLEPFNLLSFIAAHTSRIRLGTGVVVVPQRNPSLTAKQVADLDVLSGGRFDFGVGVGWLAEEFQALDMPFATRAKRCAEYIDAMRALWTQAEPSFDGETVHIPRCHFNPKPVQAGGPPIYFGGESQAALARVATRGDGWYGFNLDPAAVRERLAALEALLAAAGRQRSDIQVAIGPNSKPVTPDTVAGYREAGVDQLVVGLMAGNVDSLRRRIDSMRATVGM